jgi:GTP cyclohydrolase I
MALWPPETMHDVIRKIISHIGDDNSRSELKDTPDRVLRSWGELFAGYRFDPKSVFKLFDEPCEDMVIVKDVEFYSTCEHHMLPFHGKGHIAYIPGHMEKVIGASKLPRLLDGFSRRLQIQERICRQVVDAIEENLLPKGAICVLEARHFCMCSRGVNKQESIMVTSSVTGVFKETATKMEFLSLINRKGL